MLSAFGRRVARFSRRIDRFLRPRLRYWGAIPFIAALTALVGFSLWAGFDLYDRHLKPHRVVVAAGGEDGESFLILETTLKLIQKRHSNVSFEIRRTRGTEENLSLLKTGEADLAAGQADVALEQWLRLARAQTHNGWALIAVLFVDKFQLLSCTASPPTLSVRQALSRLQRRGDASVYLPFKKGGPSGGQRYSFERMARHYGLRAGPDFQFVDDSRRTTPACDEQEHGNLIARVRVAGNRGVQAAIDQGWRLVQFPRPGSLLISNPALHAATIKAGTYRAAPTHGGSEPRKDVATVGIQRLLLARRHTKLPDWLLRDIARVLTEKSTTLARASRAERGPQGIGVRPVERLFLAMPSLNRTLRSASKVPLHPAAALYYNPDLTWIAWLRSHADVIGLTFAIPGLVASFFVALSSLIIGVRKRIADHLNKQATWLMIPKGPPPGRDFAPDLDPVGDLRLRVEERTEAELGRFRARLRPRYKTELPRIEGPVSQLAEARARLALLDEVVFRDAERALTREEISEDSFRTFNETYKAARESIEMAVDRHRRAISLIYVQRLLNPDRSVTIDDVFRFARPVLTDDLVFSRESFRTFSDAYTLAKSQARSSRPDDSDTAPPAGLD